MCAQGQRKQEAWYKGYAQHAKEAIQRAVALLPDEWAFQVFLGKLKKKLGLSASQVNPSFLTRPQ